jgi:hypothetical protein
MREKYFFKMLSFERQEKCKIAKFTDKFGEEAIVITTWDKVIPGLRYNCKLSCKHSDLGGEREYKMISFKIWYDNIQVITGEGIIQVTLDDKVVPELDFDCIKSTNVEESVQSLREYFKEKTFQLSTVKDRERFVELYRKSCEHLYNRYKKNMIKNVQNKVCKESLV